MEFRNRLTRWLAQRERVRPEDYVGSDEAKNEQVVREGFVAKAKRYLRQIPMATDVVALYFCLLDAKTPMWVKGTVAAALAYFILPADAVPDILPLVGLSDDISVLTAAITAVSAHLTDEHRQKARQWMEAEKVIDVTPAEG
ncbi:MAG: DUF1232 domain-containing protein [Isosphaeraceae bacterium]|nr:DUF1232 domain-containing protein [Isosphaeraceae bacterium]